ncbi:MAG: ATP-dependent 6-phosphofructokinase [Phycisphaerales bacterium]|nr:ATP-dependent 6-phosphofructokinase [Phycisphaerales bacterium]
MFGVGRGGYAEFDEEKCVPDFTVQQLGPRKVPSTYQAHCYVPDVARTMFDTTVRSCEEAAARCVPEHFSGFELAGARSHLYFDPTRSPCGIVTCGGLCPGLNNVIRAIVMQLHHSYGVPRIYGFRYGFAGLIPASPYEPMVLDPATISSIHHYGGSILSSSRGPQPIGAMVDTLERLNIRALFCVGGDGTFRGTMGICDEIAKRGLSIGVVAVPKTIDNDIPFTSRTFGFETAYSIAASAIGGAHVEAEGALNGIGLVKLMGRHAGFIAAHAALACRDANFVLIPEVPFDLDGPNGLLIHIEKRLHARRHAVIVVAEGVGEHLSDEAEGGQREKDASGNVRMVDIGPYLKQRIERHFKARGLPISLKYIDPSYLIRSAPANPNDSLFAGILGQMAAHAAVAGKTAMFVGYWNNQFTHVPLSAAVSNSKRIDPNSNFWQSVLECTGQPTSMTNDGRDALSGVCTLFPDSTTQIPIAHSRADTV